VLPGGKVQIRLDRGEADSSAAALLKLPLVPYAESRLRDNADNLIRLAQTSGIATEHRRLFPILLADGDFESQSYYLESFVNGRAMADFMHASSYRPDPIGQVVSFWLDLQSRLVRPVKVTDTIFTSLFVDFMHRLQEWLQVDEDCRSRLQRMLDYWYERFAGRDIGVGLVHGDFSPKNLLVDPHTQNVTGLIDWDLADFFSIPLLDVLHFFVRLDGRSFRDPSPAIALRLGTEDEGLHRVYFHIGTKRFGYRPDDWPAIIMFYWLYRQRGYFGSAKVLDQKFLRRQFYDMLDLFESHVLTSKAGVVV